MAQYRKKPVIINAVQWNGSWPPIMDWLDDLHGGRFRIPLGTVPPVRLTGADSLGDKLEIDTPEGTMTASLGDWIIQGVQGELYPCKPDIFEATYDLVGEE